MPSISEFQGITIYLHWEWRGPHHLPHFHVHYAQLRASFSIDPPGLLVGALPRRQLRLVLAWAELHQGELMENWKRVSNRQHPFNIEGL